MNDGIYVKIGLFGDSSVGKTTIVNRYKNPDCDINKFSSTIGVDYALKNYVFEKYTIKLQIWDTAGIEKFQSITQSYYRDLFCPIFFFSLNDYESFKNIKTWLTKYNNYKTGNAYKIFLIGNKSDLDVTVPKNEIDKLCEEKFLIYRELNYTKIKEINEIFEEIANNCHAELEINPEFNYSGIKNNISNKIEINSIDNSSKCCNI